MDQLSFLRARFQFEGVRIDSDGLELISTPLDWILVHSSPIFWRRSLFPRPRDDARVDSADAHGQFAGRTGRSGDRLVADEVAVEGGDLRIELAGGERR